MTKNRATDLFNGTDEPMRHVDVTLTGSMIWAIAVNTTVQTARRRDLTSTNLRPSKRRRIHDHARPSPLTYEHGDPHSDGARQR